MATTKRDHNKNFFKWEPVKEGDNRFTPNTPLNWFHELPELVESTSFEDEESGAAGGLLKQEEILMAEEILKRTPTNDELLKTAKRFPPPPEWFEMDEEKPF
jgi:hypothetical protein